ncbi:carboxypeptidase M32 [Amphibacillus sp. Q70]|uniref:carboxypeptidase M32 n=1 Tax=Amphibacillus sp. Q70 TaxID=3453416 RepID=UPI003F8440CE
MTSAEQKFIDLMKQLTAYNEAIALIHWDLRTKIPKKGMDQRSETIGLLSEKVHQLKTSDQMRQLLDQLKTEKTSSVIEKAVEECEKEYQKYHKIPNEELVEFITMSSKSETVWQEAREKNDFSILQPYLEKLVAFNKKFAVYRGYQDNKYEGLLNDYEPGLTTAVLDRVFGQLKTALIELVQKINQSSVKVDADRLLKHFPKKDQEGFSLAILDKMGYDFDAGRLDETIHPFATGINPNDVRVTTRYDEQDFKTAVFGTIHEGGHALYEQNIDADLYQTVLAGGTSMGIHESQSLFWENFIGRSQSFWQSHFELFKKYAPATFHSIDFDTFYQAINQVKPSMIRIEADELTYSLHIIMRYELEKALIDGDLKVKDLPEAWNQKMEDYLGVRPANDREGVLQDIHWAAGDFGYFPTYALGYMYAAQLYGTIQEQINLDNMIRSGDFEPIKAWLTEHIHRHGKMKKPLEMIEQVTGEGLNPDYLIQYLTEKYSKIYQI